MRRRRSAPVEAGQNYLARLALLEAWEEPEEWEAPPPPALLALCFLAEAERLMAALHPGLKRLGITAGPRLGREMVGLGPHGTAWLEPGGWWWEPPRG